MSDIDKKQLTDKMLNCKEKIKALLVKIDSLETDKALTLEEKFAAIKIVREELNLVGTEIDSLKKKINLLNDYSIN